MVTYPELLIPATVENLYLSSGTLVRVPKAEPRFLKWQGEFTEDTYGNKPLLDVDGEPMFAELAILRLFQKDGWDGVWVDTFRKRYRTAWGEKGIVKLPGDKLRLLKTINQRVGSGYGCFDVFCWKGDRVVFAESKRKLKDSIRETQLIWLEATIQSGLEPDYFLIVEWSFSGSLGKSDGAYTPRATQRRITLPKNLAAVEPEVIENSGIGAENSAEFSTSHEAREVFFDAYDTDAHGKFLKWRERNRRGYVISRRARNDAMLHRAYCGHFEHGDKSASLTRTMKVCSSDRQELEAWARENMDKKLKKCRSCM